MILGAHPDGTPFSTVIRNPRGDGYATTVSLSDTSFVTSGDYERYVTLNGEHWVCAECLRDYGQEYKWTVA